MGACPGAGGGGMLDAGIVPGIGIGIGAGICGDCDWYLIIGESMGSIPPKRALELKPCGAIDWEEGSVEDISGPAPICPFWFIPGPG